MEYLIASVFKLQISTDQSHIFECVNNFTTRLPLSRHPPILEYYYFMLVNVEKFK